MSVSTNALDVDGGAEPRQANLGRLRVHTACAVLLPVLLLVSGCDRGPEGQLTGRWELDEEATIAEMQEKNGAAAGLAEVMMTGGRRVLNFASDGTMTGGVYTEGEGQPGVISGVPLEEEEAEWEIIEAGENTLTVRVTGGEREFDEWEEVLHFESDDRFYLYTGPNEDVREYWVRD